MGFRSNMLKGWIRYNFLILCSSLFSFSSFLMHWRIPWKSSTPPPHQGREPPDLGDGAGASLRSCSISTSHTVNIGAGRWSEQVYPLVVITQAQMYSYALHSWKLSIPVLVQRTWACLHRWPSTTDLQLLSTNLLHSDSILTDTFMNLIPAPNLSTTLSKCVSKCRIG